MILKLLFDQKVGRLLHAIAGVAATVYVAFHLLPLAFLKPDPLQKALAPTWVSYYPIVFGLAGVLLVVAAVVALRKAYRDVRNDMSGAIDGRVGTPTEASNTSASSQGDWTARAMSTADATAAAARATPMRAANARQASRNPAPKGFGKRG